MKNVSIIIPVYNQLSVTINCLQDLIKTSSVNMEIILVDDCSKEQISIIIPKLFPDVRIIRNNNNLGFAKTCNNGIKIATHDLICLLNNDVRLPDAMWLKKMTDTLEFCDITAPAGGRMDDEWNYIPGEATKKNEKFSYLVGWCLLAKKAVYDKIGLMPERYGKGFWEDVEWGYLAKKFGFKAEITENTGVKHLYHTTFKAEGFNLSEEYHAKRKIFLEAIKNV
jgi:GT2 family glycosyltransferase